MDFRFRFPAMSTRGNTYEPPHATINNNHHHTQQSTTITRVIMPKLSWRNPKVGELFLTWMNLRRRRLLEFFILGEDPFNIFDVLQEQEAKRQFRIEERLRYSTCSRVKYRMGVASAIFEEDLREREDAEEHEPWLNDAEFKDKYRLTRSSFWLIVDLIKDHPVFQSKFRKQAPVEHQLLTLLCFLGMEGNGMSDRKGRSVFRAAKGTIRGHKDRVVEALLGCLYEDSVKWPDPAERRLIATRIRAEFGIPNCVGVADGTLLPLAFRPSTEDYADYKGRKMHYTLTMLVVNDDKRKIRYFNAGWPGSTHDDRVFRNSQLAQDLESHFLDTEYIIGDSAYSPQNCMVSVYKKPVGAPMHPDNEIFNTKLAKPRVSSEHTIGILKGRFPFLRSIRMRLTGKKSFRKILRYITVCVILHNFLVDRREDEIDDVGDDDLSDIDADNELNRPVEDYLHSGTRREQVKNYLLENHMYF
jgi:hypothetical protein